MISKKKGEAGVPFKVQTSTEKKSESYTAQFSAKAKKSYQVIVFAKDELKGSCPEDTLPKDFKQTSQHEKLSIQKLIQWRNLKKYKISWPNLLKLTLLAVAINAPN